MKNIRSLVDTKLVERLNHVDNLTKIIFDAIGLPQKKHQLWAVRDLRTLTIMTHDSILATRMRLEQDQIIYYINQNSALVIDKVIVKMTMPEMTRIQKPKSTYEVSGKNAEIISSIAESIEDSELRDGLLRIAGKNQ